MGNAVEVQWVAPSQIGQQVLMLIDAMFSGCLC